MHLVPSMISHRMQLNFRNTIILPMASKCNGILHISRLKALAIQVLAFRVPLRHYGDRSWLRIVIVVWPVVLPGEPVSNPLCCQDQLWAKFHLNRMPFRLSLLQYLFGQSSKKQLLSCLSCLYCSSYRRGDYKRIHLL